MTITQQNNATQVHKLRSRSRSKHRSRLKLIPGGLAALLFGLITVAAVVLGYAFRDNPEINDRPLVLIHSPLNWEQVSEGDGVLVHATARSPGGIKRVELWVDDQLIAQREADQSKSPKSMVLSADWVPTIAGSHRLIVRATSGSNINGQASVVVESIEGDEQDLTHTVQEGETLDTIAQEYGTTPADLGILNPGVEPGAAPVPGTELVIPNDEPPSEGTPPIPTDSEPPSPVGEPPAPFSFFFPGFRVFSQEPPAEPTQLRMELLDLRTPIAYEGLTCYIGMADRTPRRYPDADWDPSTDESFTRIKSVDKKSTSWNVASYLAGKRIPAFSWPEDQSLPLDIACVGIAGGGTQSFRLGRLELAIPPEDWDGTIRRARVVGAEGAFAVIYRVGHTETEPTGVPKRLDTSMNAPTNVRVANYSAVFAPEPDPSGLGDEPTSVVEDFRVDPFAPPVLLWSYTPGEDEDGNTIAIDGFRIYLNGTLLWMERPDRMIGSNHYTVLPPEWLEPPCGQEYTVTVTAWRSGGDDDGLESRDGNPAINFETPASICRTLGVVHFKTLQTLILDGDGGSESRSGKIGPPYGEFFVNEELVSFDVGDLANWSWGGTPWVWGLTDNTSYNLDNNDFWHFEHGPYFIVEEDEGDTSQIGFHIMDEDSGRCRHPDDPGCPDLICEGSIDVNFLDNPSPEGQIPSTNGACLVSYEWEPRAEYLMEGYSGDAVPLPSLVIEDIVVDGTTGVTSFTIRNEGDTTWAHLPLEIAVTNTSGASRDSYTINDFYLEPDDTFDATYTPSGEPFYPCLTPDPNDIVREIADSWPYDRTVCAALPDLSIDSVIFDPAGGEHLRVQIVNEEPGHEIVNGNIRLSIHPLDGSFPDISANYSEIDLEEHEVDTLDFPLETISHNNLLGGYTVQAEMWPLSEESRYDNNIYHVNGTERITVALCYAEIPDVRGDMFLVPYVVSGEYELPQETTGIFHDELSPDQPYRYEGCKYPPQMFDIAGDQLLKVVVAISQGSTRLDIWEDFITPFELNYGIGEVGSEPSAGDEPCMDWIVIQGTYPSGSSEETWRAAYVICRLDTEPG
jgi:LysM repeat protein